MRHIFIAAAVLSLLAVPAMAATAGQSAMTTCAASWKAMSAADKAKTTYKAYSATCMKAANAKPATGPAMAGPAMKGPAMAGPAMAAKPVAPVAVAKPMVAPVAAGKTTAAAPGSKMKECAAKWNAMKADGSAKGTTYKAFSSICLKKS